MDFPDYNVEEELINQDENYTENDGDDDNEEIEDFSNASYGNSVYQQNTAVERYACDTCEREFRTYWQHQKHMSEHRTCNIEGCTFTAHEKIIAKHIEMQHCTGLYDKIRNVNTPEDIERWISERKKKYPSKENVEKRYKRQEEMLKRGEKLKKDTSRFDNKKNRTKFGLASKHKKIHNQQFGHYKRKSTKRKCAIQKNRSVSLIDDKSDWNGSLFPFRGTNQLYNEEVTDDKVIIDDDEWMQTNKNNVIQNQEVINSNVAATSDSNEEIKKEKVVVSNNALGALMNAYNSDDSDIEEDDKNVTSVLNQEIEKREVSINDNSNISDDEAPTEEKIVKLEVPFLKEEKPKSDESTSAVKHGNKRKRTRKNERGNTSKDSSDISKTQTANSSNKIYKRRRITLLERLLANEIRHERNVILQCVRYVVENDFFDKKETEK